MPLTSSLRFGLTLETGVLLGRAGSNGTPEGWLIFGGGLNKWIIG